MTADEQKMLADIHRALMEPSATGDAPLILQIGEVCKAYQRGRWAAKAIIWGLPTLAAIGASVQVVMNWFSSGQGAGQ